MRTFHGVHPLSRRRVKDSPVSLGSERKSQQYIEIDSDDDDDLTGDALKQLVIYDANREPKRQDLIPYAEQTEYETSYSHARPYGNFGERILPSFGTYTVQCNNCLQWRLVPTKEIYEALRESILSEPFVCERAREWDRDLSCSDPGDLSQDGTSLWAIDKPNIAQPPPGWDREVRIRGAGSTRFADVYYTSPTGKKFRSSVEIQRYLMEHPQYGVTLDQFSFQIPTPMQENYVRKRSYRYESPMEFQFPLEPEQANPIAWARPPTHKELISGSLEAGASIKSKPKHRRNIVEAESLQDCPEAFPSPPKKARAKKKPISRAGISTKAPESTDTVKSEYVTE